MRGWFAIFYREMLILRKRFTRQIATMSVAPLLYIVAFGFGMGSDIVIDGQPYLNFLIPGLIALSSMTHSFSIASEINISRFYFRVFEEFQAAPVGNLAIVTGETLAGMARGVLAAMVIMVFAMVSGIPLSFNMFFWIGVLLNSFVFSALAVCLAMVVKSHQDQSLLTGFVITPMAFLGGTFFPLDRMPTWAQGILYALPITHASRLIRGAALGVPPAFISLFILLGTGALFYVLAYYCVNAAKD
jgi:ABC-2 type transport system permease protein